MTYNVFGGTLSLTQSINHHELLGLSARGTAWTLIIHCTANHRLALSVACSLTVYRSLIHRSAILFIYLVCCLPHQLVPFIIPNSSYSFASH